MKKTYMAFALMSAFLFNAVGMYAQSSSEYQANREHKGLIWSTLHGLDYEFKAGVNIGGTSPLPLPEEIRSIDGYKPGLGISVEGNATKWLGKEQKWGISIGLRLEGKSMKADATVKNYGMEIIEGDGKVKGLWTGGVHTKARMSYLTFPILGNLKIGNRWKVSLGPYLSYMIDGDFSGNVYEGHLRTGNYTVPDETGDRVNFSGSSIATYDFSDELRRFQWGVQAGATWKAYRHLNLHADLTWGLNDIFQKDFTTISFAMYPIYLNVGFGYEF